MNEFHSFIHSILNVGVGGLSVMSCKSVFVNSGHDDDDDDDGDDDDGLNIIIRIIRIIND